MLNLVKGYEEREEKKIQQLVLTLQLCGQHQPRGVIVQNQGR